jgi:hypothetical protein
MADVLRETGNGQVSRPIGSHDHTAAPVAFEAVRVTPLAALHRCLR